MSFKVAGYPIDEATKRRQGPSWVIGLDHVLWWVFLLLYLVMMSEMMPRLWHYQVELPPRTVAHVIVGISVGVALIVKISFERFFRHMQEWVPGLAAALLGGTILLSGLSVPFALREFGLAQSAVGGGVYSQENRDRVAKLLPQAEMPEDVDLAALTTVQALQAGRDVLAGKCVVCHDLKTILSQPPTPCGWGKTVAPMARKPRFAIGRERQNQRTQFSCWRYLNISMKEFIADLNEMDHFVGGEGVLPRFIQRARESSTVH